MSPRVLQTKMRIRDILNKVKSQAEKKSDIEEMAPFNSSAKKLSPGKIIKMKPVAKNTDAAL